MSLMHCPRCGSSVQTSADGGAICVRTGALLSREFLEELESYSMPAGQPRLASPLSCDPEGTWFCPDCACEMIHKPGSVDCPECGRGYNGFVNGLLKSNPHP